MGTYACENCGATFPTEADVRDHALRAHGETAVTGLPPRSRSEITGEREPTEPEPAERAKERPEGPPASTRWREG
jgi:hypothetical protein